MIVMMLCGLDETLLQGFPQTAPNETRCSSTGTYIMNDHELDDGVCYQEDFDAQVSMVYVRNKERPIKIFR